ncbi:MAG: UDP-2,3-diacylglucosamine diphosphatase [Undibacterium sp.]|nr:UDP-2,3-diacylglucosamine diphosphatase [Undibacterium sp.]
MVASLTKNRAQAKLLALFVSDIHLSDSLPNTTVAFLDFLKTTARNTERLYLLGDLFEYWAGDDDIDDQYNHHIVSALRELHQCGVQLFWMAGNRDFLVGKRFANETGAQILSDPHPLELAGKSLLLSHGDSLCTDDTNYIAFRAMVRQENWQTQFLSKPLTERKAIINHMRLASKEDQRSKSMEIMDVNQGAVNRLFETSQAKILIHGHTHRTALHQEFLGLRYVLPDWDCEQKEHWRGGYLSLHQDGKFEFNSLAQFSTNAD